MTDDCIAEIASPFLVWDGDGYVIADKLGFARALLAAGASEGQAEFEWPKLPGFPSPSMYSPSHGHPLFSEHQMQGYANAYGEAVRVKLSAEIAALRERIAGMEKDAERWRELVKLAVANGCWWIKFDFENHDGPLTAEQMNDGIDAAIAKEKHP